MRIAAAERSMSAVVVGQPQTEMRRAGRPRQTVPPAHSVPSAWIRAILANAPAVGDLKHAAIARVAPQRPCGKARARHR